MGSINSTLEDGQYNKTSGEIRGSTRFLRDKGLPHVGAEAAQDVNTNSSSPVGEAPAGKTSTTTSQKLKSDKLFFDPKRIFQTRSNKEPTTGAADRSKAGEERKRNDSHGGGGFTSETVLNNGKPNNTSSKASTVTAHRKADYINNDLRDGASPSSQTNTSNSGSGKRTNQASAYGRHNHKKHGSKEGSTHTSSNADKTKGGDSRGRRRDSQHQEDNSIFSKIDWDLVGKFKHLFFLYM
jgi:hypothetical protein